MAKVFYFRMGEGPVGPAYALAEDGTVLGALYGVQEAELPVKLGLGTEYLHAYQMHYPEGFDLVFVDQAEIGRHSELQAALRRSRGGDDGDNDYEG